MSQTNPMQNDLVLLQAGLIEHLTCFVFTGRTCSLRRAARLAGALAACTAVPEAARAHWLGLAEALEDMSLVQTSAVTADLAQSGQSSAATQRGGGKRHKPWLVWENLGSMV